MNSLVKHIPNTITTLNLICGLLGVVFAFKGRSDIAFCLMLLASVFDFCDGGAARLLNAYSPMGKELDSLCDMVSFGVLPSIMAYVGYGQTSVVPLVMAVAAALRLAKFNIDDNQHDSFIGLATPVSALFMGALCCFSAHEPSSFVGELFVRKWFLPMLSVGLSILNVCALPMFSMKFKKTDTRVIKLKREIFLSACVLAAIAVLCLRIYWPMMVLLSTLIYIVLNLLFLIPLWRR
mgnify:FL=1